MPVTLDQTRAALHARAAAERRAAQERAADLRARVNGLVPWLVETYGVGEVWLFGSLVTGDAHAGSDVDLAVDAIARGRLFEAGGALSRRLGVPVDLVELDRARPALAQAIRRDGERLR